MYQSRSRIDGGFGQVVDRSPKPDQFYAVSSFALKADQDQKSMVCTLQIARYFKEGS